jgi:hypothetical protein
VKVGVFALFTGFGAFQAVIVCAVIAESTTPP